jgi:glycosyltransferase involved in cell wall biosynthesis
MRVALVHYWLVTMRGGEKVLDALCELYPQAEIFTHVYVPGAVSERIRSHRVQTTFIGRLPRAEHWYKRYLPLMPLALSLLDLSGFDLVVSSESGPAKGVRVPPGAVHVCYCHTPMRYIWNMYEDYRRSADPLSRLAMPLLAPALRRWDRRTAQRVDCVVANSANVAARVRECWGREAQVIPPPVDTAGFDPTRPAEDFYLSVGALTAYKRIDLAVEAFTRLGRKLVVVGSGECSARLKAMAGPTVSFLGHLPDAAVRDLYARCRAFVFPGEEDFGIAPVEAMAAGKPVVAYGAGGALETVLDGKTGVFFREQTPEALAEAVTRFETLTFDPASISAHARGFDRSLFLDRMRRAIESCRAAKERA